MILTRGVRSALIVATLLLAAGCGEDYRPPSLETTGVPAVPLNQLLDLDVSLPGLRVRGSMWGGVTMEIRLELEGTGYGQHPARARFGPAYVDGREVPVQDLSGGRTTIAFTPDNWATGLLGPLIIEGTPFEMLLDGEADPGLWHLAGSSYETQTATTGGFEGWRRHRFLVAETDFLSTAGAIAEVSVIRGNEIHVQRELEFVSSDPVLRLTGGATYAVNRFTFDNLQRLDPGASFRTAWQAGVGEGSNPQDVLQLAYDRALVSRYEPPFDDVAIFDPQSGVIRSTIPLGEWAENRHGTPRASRMVLADETVFVGLQDIDRGFTEFREGKLAVIDPTLEQVSSVIPLGGKNPSEIEVIRGADGRTRLYVAMAGIFVPRELSGGVAVVDVTNRVVERWALDDDDAGGNVGGFALASEQLGYVVVTTESYVNQVKAFDPRNGAVGTTVWESYDFIPEIEVDTGGLLAVPDRSLFQPRLCLYRTPVSADDAEMLLGCAALQLPPFSIEALD
jgi:hypothetical protein